MDVVIMEESNRLQWFRGIGEPRNSDFVADCRCLWLLIGVGQQLWRAGVTVPPSWRIAQRQIDAGRWQWAADVVLRGPVEFRQ